MSERAGGGQCGRGPERQGSLVREEGMEKPGGWTMSGTRTLQALACTVGIFPGGIGSCFRVWVVGEEVIWSDLRFEKITWVTVLREDFREARAGAITAVDWTTDDRSSE